MSELPTPSCQHPRLRSESFPEVPSFVQPCVKQRSLGPNWTDSTTAECRATRQSGRTITKPGRLSQTVVQTVTYYELVLNTSVPPLPPLRGTQLTQG